MVSSSLILHRGAVEVPRAQLIDYPAPDPQGRWFPVAHFKAVDIVSQTLDDAGYRIVKERFGVSHDGARLFGVLDLATSLNDGVGLAVGLRNSTDKSFPLGFVGGSRCFVCDNLAFSGELLVRRKHTRFGEVRFQNAIAGAVSTLPSFIQQETTRVARLQDRQIDDEAASHMVIRSMERGILNPTAIPQVWEAWRHPKHDFGPPTLWRLLNAYTSVLGERMKNPNEYAGLSIRLNAFLTPEEVWHVGEEETCPVAGPVSDG